MEVRFFMTDASEGFLPTAQGAMGRARVDAGSIPEPGLCSRSLHGEGWGCTAPDQSSHGTLRSCSPLLCLFFFFPPLPLFLNKINKYNLTLIVTVLINV